MVGPGILGSYAIVRTTEHMVTGLMSGLAVSAPATFGVLLLAMGSLVVSLYAMLTIVLSRTASECVRGCTRHECVCCGLRERVQACLVSGSC